jgi:hypothetical protein
MMGGVHLSTTRNVTVGRGLMNVMLCFDVWRTLIEFLPSLMNKSWTNNVNCATYLCRD